MSNNASFTRDFQSLTGFQPYRWQTRLFERLCALDGDLPQALDLPTGLGKTSVLTLWLLARAANPGLPRRLVYIVDRRAVVDQATREAERLQWALGGAVPPAVAGRFRQDNDFDHDLRGRLRAAHGLSDADDILPISTLRGQHADNRAWLADPSRSAIIVGTVDMIGSRLLFSGYGVSRRMRPYAAGLLGMDSLVLLDEAHLVPPFEDLLRSISSGHDVATRASLRNPAGPEQDLPVQPMRLMSLSATGADMGGSQFSLEAEDREDARVHQRLAAAKRLTLHTLPPADKPDKDLIEALADRAWDLGRPGIGVVVFCNSREVAQKVRDGLEARRKRDGVERIETNLLTGARRVFERDALADWLNEWGFTGKAPHDDTLPIFLVATSAGEVGVDMDANHMVCDLVAWERMVQRLGRVNRRGVHEGTRIEVISAPRSDDVKTPSHRRQETLAAAVRSLPARQVGDALIYDASPGAITALKRSAAGDPQLRGILSAATTPAPLRPELTRPLLEAWSMTSLADHTARPEVAPWLRGWVENSEPQARVVWRAHLPVRDALHDGDGTLPPKGELERYLAAITKNARAITIALPPKGELERYLEAAPVGQVECLETESRRIMDMLVRRAEAVMTRIARQHKDHDDRLKPGSIVILLLGRDGTLMETHGGALTLEALAGLKSAEYRVKRRRERLEADLSGCTLMVDARLGGLSSKGLLDPKADGPVPALDGADPFDVAPQKDSTDTAPLERAFRVTRGAADAPPAPLRGEALSLRLPVRVTGEGDMAEEVVDIFVRRGRRSATGDPALSPRAQALSEHHAWTGQRARDLAHRCALSEDLGQAVALAAELHDAGKDCALWQTAMGAPPAERPLAKTTGVGARSGVLDGYRHEFGTLKAAENSSDVMGLAPGMRALVLHLIAAHHGYARPVIAPIDPDLPPDSPRVRLRAREVALRFADLQARYGPWGLAWLEAVLRAADQMASRDNDLREDEPVRQQEAV